MLAVDFGAASRAAAADCRADFEAHHSQGALAILEDNLSQEDLPETGDSEAMSDAFDARAVRFHLFDASAKKSSARPDCFQRMAGLKRILRYLAEFPIIIKISFGRNERRQAFEKLGVQFDFDGAPGDAEIFELAADHGNETLRFVQVMLGIEPGHNAIGSDDVEEIEPLDRGGHQCVVAAIVSLVGPRYVRVALAERNKLAKLKILDARIAMAADDGKRTSRLHVDGLTERTCKTATEGMGASMVVKRAKGLGAHLVTLVN